IALSQRTAGEQWLDADHRTGGNNRKLKLAFHGAAARLRQADDHLRLQRTRRFRDAVERDLETRVSARVGLRQVVERLARSDDLLVGGSKTGAFKPGPLIGGRDDEFAFEIEIASGRAI